MPSSIPTNLRDWPLWHFAQLESALERGDDRAAVDAVRELDRLGIEVRFHVPPTHQWKVAMLRREGTANVA